MIGRDLAERKQWRNVWGTIRNFRYDLDKVEAIVSGRPADAVGMGVWQSDGYHPNGDRSTVPAAPTVTLAARRWAIRSSATHTHMSLFAARRTELRQVG